MIIIVFETKVELELVCQIGVCQISFSSVVTLIYANFYSWEEYISAQCRKYYIPEILHPDWKCKITLNDTIILC